MRRAAGLALLAVVLGAAACGGGPRLGTGNPACDLEFSEVGTATIMQAQAVATADWGPCIEDLAPGWELRNTEPRSGRAGFVLDSDRVGADFLDVSLVESCEPPETATHRTPPNDEIERLVLERETTAPLPVTVVAISSRHVDTAFQIAKDLLDTRVDGHRISVHTATSSADPAGVITRALAEDRFVLIVDDHTLTDGLLELRHPMDPRAVRVDDLDHLLEEIAEGVAPPTYDATWWHLFPGGCIVFEFDARGAGAEVIGKRIETAVGFYPLDDLRLYAAANGVVYGTAP